MYFKLFLVFALVPVIELAILIRVGSFIGVFNTVAIVILTALAGAHMVRREGLGVMHRIQQNMQEGTFPGDELLNGAMILIAGALLLTPGFFTDVVGFLLVFPVSRTYIKKAVTPYIKKKMDSRTFDIDIS